MKKPLMIGTTSAIANCAVKTGCITNSAETEEDLVEIAIEVIDKLLRKEWFSSLLLKFLKYIWNYLENFLIININIR